MAHFCNGKDSTSSSLLLAMGIFHNHHSYLHLHHHQMEHQCLDYESFGDSWKRTRFFTLSSHSVFVNILLAHWYRTINTNTPDISRRQLSLVYHRRKLMYMVRARLCSIIDHPADSHLTVPIDRRKFHWTARNQHVFWDAIFGQVRVSSSFLLWFCSAPTIYLYQGSIRTITKGDLLHAILIRFRSGAFLFCDFGLYLNTFAFH